MPRLGLALSSGAARGWAHLGVLRAFDEMGLEPDIVAGASAGALAGAAYLTDARDALADWAGALSPLNALNFFEVAFAKGGVLSAEPAFKAFADLDCAIESLPKTFIASATDLATGEEARLNRGSLLRALQASTAIPVLFHAVEHEGRWLVDGALSNPLPVSAARDAGAEIVIAVELNAWPRTLDRLKAQPPSFPAATQTAPPADTLQQRLAALVAETRQAIERRLALARAKQRAKPQLFETMVAAIDIFQAQLSAARAAACPPDILIAPDLKGAPLLSFDRGDELIEAGYRAAMDKAEEIERALAK
ncbi:MAG: patatin-like phospholipase RssA [Parvularculaceae bacterium]